MKKLILPLAGILMFGSACLSPSEDNTVRTDDGAIVEEGELGVFAIQVGDCFSDDSDTEIESVDGQSCDADHLYEVYHAFDVVADEYPGEAEILSQAETGCLGTFSGFVGIAYEESQLDISYLYPTVDSWNLGDDREVLCMVVNVDGSPRSGSAQGLGI